MKTLFISLIIDLPFAPDDPAACTWSHENVIVMDSPDGEDDGEIYAPVAGDAYTFVDSQDGGMGAYVKLDQGDGSYVILAHLQDVAVLDHQVVQTGQLIGYEGIDGVHGGHDVLIGRFQGLAASPHVPEKALPLSVRASRVPYGQPTVLETSDLVCGTTDGGVYRSALHWSTRPPDELNEGHMWIRAFGENLWIDPPSFHGRWFVFPEGVHLINLSVDPFWMDVGRACDRAPSALCSRRGTAAWFLCIDSRDGDIMPSQDCL